ncbi:MAG TPA: hypothetical protein VLM40_05520, partial [Gemmata sp.]|nr:hypothetical protein [Gemmata sp.]
MIRHRGDRLLGTDHERQLLADALAGDEPAKVLLGGLDRVGKAIAGLLQRSAANYGWCFDCVPEENSLLLGFGTMRV